MATTDTSDNENENERKIQIKKQPKLTVYIQRLNRGKFDVRKWKKNVYRNIIYVLKSCLILVLILPHFWYEKHVVHIYIYSIFSF